MRQFSCYRTAGLVLSEVSSRQSHYLLLSLLGECGVWLSRGASQTLWCYQRCLVPQIPFYTSKCFKSERKTNSRWQSEYDVLSESSLSSLFPSSSLIAVIPLACALRCLCSRSLACTTSYPLPVKPMLIITPVFQTLLFPGGIF